jgi:hypothetical protein
MSMERAGVAVFTLSVNGHIISISLAIVCAQGVVEMLGEWLEVCKAWPPGDGRNKQLDALARRAMDRWADASASLLLTWVVGLWGTGACRSCGACS